MSPDKGSSLVVGSLTVGSVGVKEGNEGEVRVMRDTEADSWLSMARVAFVNCTFSWVYVYLAILDVSGVFYVVQWTVDRVI